MTQLEFKDIKTRLSVWKAERHLTTKQQRDGLVSNLLEELTEYSRANSVEVKIDALCDMMVFIINSYDEAQIRYNYVKYYKKAISADRLASNLLDALVDLKPIECVTYCVERLCEQIRHLGYKPYECMLETIKEISSRTGYFDETINKFIKDKSPEAQAKWYKADYSLCKEQ